MYARPTNKETEEDILKLQEEFMRKVANNDVVAAAKISKESAEEKSIQDNANAVNTQFHLLEDTFESIPTYISLGNVIQKTPTNSNTLPLEFSHKKGFPQAKRRDPSITATRGSIFSQQIKRLKKEQPSCSSFSDLVVKENQPMDVNFKLDKTTNSALLNMPKQSYVLTGVEKEEIHRQNLNILEGMSEEEILEERNKLLSTMDPAIIAFLKAKRKDEHESRTVSIEEQNKAAENVTVEEIESSREILCLPEAEKWLNFNVVETGKLAWMKDIEMPQVEKGKSYEARFDFDGWLLPFVEAEIDEKSRILYHHGEEPGRPGYTLKELFQLCRSNVNQQKIVSLNTIANILLLYQSGVYEGVIELPFEQIFFILRFCLDDNTPAVLNASIKAIRNLFFYPIDETCLDNLLGFGLGMVQPVLAVDNEPEDDNTVNDQQLAETNLIKCLVRSNILNRIRYIINMIQPSMETIVYCLEILTRMARDSYFVVKQILDCENLMGNICKSFLPLVSALDNADSAYGCPLLQAVKLIRILCVRNRNICEKFVNQYRIMNALTSYLANEALSTNSSGLKLQIETLHLWCVFIHFNFSYNTFRDMEPILLRMLNFHIQNTNIQPTTSYVIQGHVAALLILLTESLKAGYSLLGFTPYLHDPALLKWTTQFGLLEEFTCGKLQIITSLLKYLAVVLGQNNNLNIPLDAIETSIQLILVSKGFNVITKSIRVGSNLLSHFDVVKFGSNLKTVEAASWNAPDQIVPIISTSSSLPFLNVFSEVVSYSKNNSTKLNFLQNKHISKYLKQLNKSQDYNLVNNWFTRVESQLIVNILKIAVDVQKDLDTAMFYEIAVKCLSVFNSEQKEDIKFVLTNIVFSPQFYPCDTLLQNLDINEGDNLLKNAFDNLDNIFDVYVNVLNIKTSRSTNLCVDLSEGNVMPVDWSYSPIILLYSSQQQNKSSISEDQQIFIITNCLRWIYIYENHFPSLAKLINPTDRFCRIACTFLGSDTLFLNVEVHNLLEACLKHILASNEKNINFSKPIQGLNNFQDFYVQLLEQYQGVSYGDVLFGNFILLPLIQRHDVKYRKTLWSEYAGIVQIFNVTPEQMLYPVELFLEPAETDISLLKCYRRILATGAIRKHSALYKIANHHVQLYLNKEVTRKSCP